MVNIITGFLVIYSHFVLSQRSQCSIKQGLPCNSTEKLVPGSSFTISSKTCPNGNYPKKERCAWYFEVDGCKPSLECNSLSLKAKGRKYEPLFEKYSSFYTLTFSDVVVTD